MWCLGILRSLSYSMRVVCASSPFHGQSLRKSQKKEILKKIALEFLLRYLPRNELSEREHSQLPFPAETDEWDFAESYAGIYPSNLCAKPKNRMNATVICIKELPLVVKYCRISCLPPVSLFGVVSQAWGKDVLHVGWCGIEIPLKKEIDVMKQNS